MSLAECRPRTSWGLAPQLAFRVEFGDSQ